MTKPARYFITFLLLTLVILLLSVAAGLCTLGPTHWRGGWQTEFGGSSPGYFYIGSSGTGLHIGSQEWHLPLTHFEFVLAVLLVPASCGLIAAGMVARPLISRVISRVGTEDQSRLVQPVNPGQPGSAPDPKP